MSASRLSAFLIVSGETPNDEESTDIPGRRFPSGRSPRAISAAIMAAMRMYCGSFLFSIVIPLFRMNSKRICGQQTVYKNGHEPEETCSYYNMPAYNGGKRDFLWGNYKML